MDSSRRGNNGGQRPRGNQEHNQRRTRFNNMQPHRGFGRPPSLPAASNPYTPPPMAMGVRPFANNFMYPADMASPMFYNQGPTPSPWLVPPMHRPPLYFPFPDPYLCGEIVKQIDYYFSVENLVKDIHLRKNMDEQGWVPGSLIASFKKVLGLSKNFRLILDVMRTSKVVEVRGDKMRKRNEWKKWIIPKSVNVESFS